MSDTAQQVKVWDPAVRIFHWSLVAAFFIAYLSEDDFLSLHLLAGYTVGALVLFRVVWGFIGPCHARFSDFVRPPREALAYLKEELTGRARRYLGHNPAGGAMVVALLISLSITVATGLLVDGAGECDGLLAAWYCNVPRWLGAVAKEIHEFFANLTLLLVGLHVAGVFWAGMIHRENLVAAMWHGYKRVDEG